MANAKPDSTSGGSVGSSSGLGSNRSFTKTRSQGSLGMRQMRAPKWERNETRSKGNDPFFSTHTGDLEGGPTNDADYNLGNNLCTKKLETCDANDIAMFLKCLNQQLLILR